MWAATNPELGGRTVNANTIVEQIGIVGDDGVARPLREESKRDQDHQSIPISWGPEEIEIASGLLAMELSLDRVADFTEFELDRRILGIAVCVIFSKEVQSFVIFVFGNMKSRRLRDPYFAGIIRPCNIAKPKVCTYTRGIAAESRMGTPARWQGYATTSRC